MKKIKIFILIATSTLLFTGCRKNASPVKDGKLPAGGEKADLATSEGQEVMKTRLDAAAKVYDDLNLESVSITSETSGIEVSVNAKVESKLYGNITLEEGIKGFGVKEEMKAAKDGKNVKASASVKTTGGSLSIKGFLPGKEQGKTANIDASLSLSGINANAYLSGNKTYVDVSNAGNETFVKNVETFTNKLLGQANESMYGEYISMLGKFNYVDEVYDTSKKQFNFVDAYKKYLPDKKIAIPSGNYEWPTISSQDLEALEEKSEISLDNIGEAIQTLKEMKIDLEFVTYKDESFGVTAALGKEALKALVANFADNSENTWYNTIADMFSGFTVNASAYFNKDNLLQSVGFAIDCEAKIDKSLLKFYGVDVSTFDSYDMSYALKGKETINIKYNGVEVDLPDFSDYKEIKLER